MMRTGTEAGGAGWAAEPGLNLAELPLGTAGQDAPGRLPSITLLLPSRSSLDLAVMAAAPFLPPQLALQSSSYVLG